MFEGRIVKYVSGKCFPIGTKLIVEQYVPGNTTLQVTDGVSHAHVNTKDVGPYTKKNYVATFAILALSAAVVILSIVCVIK